MSSHRLNATPCRLVLSRMLLLLATVAAWPDDGVAQERSSVPAAQVRYGFDDVETGQLPAGWRAGPNPEYTAEVVEGEAHEGRRSVRMRSGPPGRQDFGGLFYAIDATPYRGTSIRYRAWVRTDSLGPDSGGGLWLRVDRQNSVAFMENMQDRRINDREWTQYEITAEVPQDAVLIHMGLLLYGTGEAWLDAASLVVTPGSAVGALDFVRRSDAIAPQNGKPEPPHPLTARGLKNLTAFARLLGYVRYFHPSDAAASANWDSLAIAGVRAVEAAPDPQALARTLLEIFRPVAPTLHVVAGQDLEQVRPAPTSAHGVRLETVQWVHRGLGLGNARSPYRSERIRHAVAEGARASYPGAPLRVSLGGGVSASILTILIADPAGTLPRGETAQSTGEQAVSGETQHTGADRATRLANIVLAWNVFQHFYPYFEPSSDDHWRAQLPASLGAAALDATECDHLNTLRRMVAALGDGHGHVAHVCMRNDRNPPIRLAWVEDLPVVSHVRPGVEGVQRGDQLLRVDDRDVAEVLQRQIALISAATPQWLYHRARRELLSGPGDSRVMLTLQRVSGDTAVVQLGRTEQVWSEEPPRLAAISELRPGIWYVDLERTSTAEWEAAVPTLQSAGGLVFDLRGYPRDLQVMPFLGRLTRQPITSPQMLIPRVTQPDRVNLEFQRDQWDVHPRAPYLAAPKVFLTGGAAMSYAETLLGFVEHYRIGEIIGEATAGTNGNINPFDLPGGYNITWTGMKVLKQDASQHHGVGIPPTVPVSRTRAGIAAGKDEVLEKAQEVVSGRGEP